ncbi:hypothetical protein HHK36_005416 [Tetracentron sinense]|uniref:Uncharacterized protein n=1 Tax=Tetracentron sinense TaxID=13715 RepID=A0A834ZU41_TETSI|nr:hypothetical protein HHK36_005416 [Tetracentron sinense]
MLTGEAGSSEKTIGRENLGGIRVTTEEDCWPELVMDDEEPDLQIDRDRDQDARTSVFPLTFVTHMVARTAVRDCKFGKYDVFKKQKVRSSKPVAGTCSRCGGGASVADMKTSTRFCYVPFYWRSWKAIICTFCGAVLKSYG